MSTHNICFCWEIRKISAFFRWKKCLICCCHRHCNENISIFTSAKHKWKFDCFHYSRWNFLWYSLKKSKFSFYFIVYTTMHASDIISNATKQKHERHSVDIQCLTWSAWETKTKSLGKFKLILLPKCSLHSNYENAYQHLIVLLRNRGV